MTHKKKPLRAEPEGRQKRSIAEEELTHNPVEGQGFSGCVPCAGCVYFRCVPQDGGRVRRLCTFHGVRVGIAGVPGCEFMSGGGDHE